MRKRVFVTAIAHRKTDGMVPPTLPALKPAMRLPSILIIAKPLPST
jgi:hypothetical protein